MSVYASSKNVLASFDVSNAFLNAELSEEVTILTQPAPELVQFGLVKPGTLYQCTKACYGLQWEYVPVGLGQVEVRGASHVLYERDDHGIRVRFSWHAAILQVVPEHLLKEGMDVALLMYKPRALLFPKFNVKA